MELIKLYLLFWIFAFLGWVIETIDCAILDKKIVNRGFFIGPYCPIYGFGGISMLLFLPYKDSPFVCFTLSLVTCSVIEYFTSYIMEVMFKVRWWDYSNDSFNINGRICLRNALAFGALGVLVTRYIYPFLNNFLNSLSNSAVIVFFCFVLIITLIDIIVSFKAMNKIKDIINKNIDNFKNIDATSNIKKLIKESLKIGYLEKRLVSTYHLFEKGKDKWQHFTKMKKSGYLSILLTIVLSIILGIILSEIYSNYMILTFIVSIGVLLAFIISKVVSKKWK